MKNIDVLPGISDHDLVFSEVSTKPVETRQPPRSTYLYKRADWEGFKTYTEKVKEDIYTQTQLLSKWENFGFLLNHP